MVSKLQLFHSQNMYIVDSGKLNVFRTSEDISGQTTTCVLKTVAQVRIVFTKTILKGSHKPDSSETSINEQGLLCSHDSWHRYKLLIILCY